MICADGYKKTLTQEILSSKVFFSRVHQKYTCKTKLSISKNIVTKQSLNFKLYIITNLKYNFYILTGFLNKISVFYIFKKNLTKIFTHFLFLDINEYIKKIYSEKEN